MLKIINSPNKYNEYDFLLHIDKKDYFDSLSSVKNYLNNIKQYNLKFSKEYHVLILSSYEKN